MREVEASIRILNLEVKTDNRIVWVMSQVMEDRPNYREEMIHGEEKFDLDFLERSTITFLVKELQLISDWTRDKGLQADTLPLVKILGEYLYRVLFNGKIQKLLGDALDDNDLRLIRIELQFEDGT